MRRGLTSLVAVASTLGFAADAGAATLLDERVQIGAAVDRSCFAREFGPGAEGIAARSATAPVTGMVEARLDAAGGDWDVAVFADGRTVAASAFAGPSENTGGFVAEGQELAIQACRRSGRARAARLEVRVLVASANGQRPSLVRIATPDREDPAELSALGIDLTEHGGPGYVDAVLHTPKERELLRSEGFAHSTLVADLGRQGERRAAADRRYARGIVSSALPSGRTTYRRLFDYSEELKELAARNPGLVRHFTLPERTYEGRPVEGIEITNRVGSPRSRQRPVFLQMGLHHAREWPSGEHAMEWAYELIEGAREGKRRTARLLRGTRTFVIPVVNPDGFNVSREAGEVLGVGGGAGHEHEAAAFDAVGRSYEYWRKNCRLLPGEHDSPEGNCAQPTAAAGTPGVDPNRNYGAFWGGPGASTNPTADDFRGPGPFSEPEPRNVRELISGLQVTALISNHTYSNLVLRPPGLAATVRAPDEQILREVGAAMTAENGYANDRIYQLYDVTGGAEDWSYWSTGSLAYTFEIGPTIFHPPFAEVVAEWRGSTEAAGDGKGNRGAFYAAQEAAGNPDTHSVLAGRAPAGAVLRLEKSFRTPTFEREHGTVRDHLSSRLRVPRSGRFRWHVNPSTRPLVAEDSGRKPTGEPSPPQSFSGEAGEGARPCPDQDIETEDESCFNEHAFTVPEGQGVDNGKATVRIDWADPSTDWDLLIYADSNGDGSSVGEGPPVASSAQGGTTYEEASLSEPTLVQGADYVARVVNYDAAEAYAGTITFAGPDPFRPARREAWRLTCARGGAIRSDQQVFVGRGGRRQLDLRAACGRGQ